MNRSAGGQEQRPAPPWRRRATAAAWTLVIVYVLAAVMSVGFHASTYTSHAPADVGWLGWLVTPVIDNVTFLPFVLVGAVIVSRRPRNVIGWLMLGAGLARGIRSVAGPYAVVAIGGSPADPGVIGLSAAWTRAAFESAGFQLALWFLPLLYPDGRLPSRRWRPVLWVMIVVTLLWPVGHLASERLTGVFIPFGADLVQLYDVANPLAVGSLQPLSSLVRTTAGGVVLFGGVLIVVVAAVMRFRRSRGVQRQQMKWLTFAVSLTMSLLLFDLLLRGPLGAPEPVFLAADGLVLLSMIVFPVAVGVAVLRYRLYDIDRIISRTVSYGLVVAVLGGVYVAGVVGLGAAVTGITGQGDSDLVVAVSTLAAAGLFRPVRARIQSAVDRRFNRTGYEARQAVEAFTREVRDEVDLDQIRRRIAETAAVATQPTHVSVWLTDAGE